MQVALPNPGKMVHRVTLERQSSTRDASGQPVNTWEPVLRSLPVEIRGVSGGERVFGVQIQATVNNVLITHFMASVSVTPDMRCTTRDGRHLNIVSAVDPDGMRRVLVIQTIEEVQ